MEQIYFEITIIICLAAFLTILLRHFNQPSILAYILTGIILGPLGVFHLSRGEELNSLGQLGITLLLFMLGLELKIKDLKSIGKVAVIVGCLQMWFTFITGFFLALFLGVEKTGAIYAGLALAFSSTIVTVKLLSDRKDLASLHGKIAIGVLLIQDFFAVMTLVFVSGNTNLPGNDLFFHILGLLGKVSILFGVVIFLSTHLFPRLTKSIAKSAESLFLFSLAWVFIFTAFVASPYVGFSIEIGGFLAGLALANTNENLQIISRMRALRDFFITIFFVLLGLQMKLDNLGVIVFPVILLVLFTAIIKPYIIMQLVSLVGYKKRTSYLVGISLSHISEFSLLILFLGNTSGVISDTFVSAILFASIITYTTTTYVMQHANNVYKLLIKYLFLFEAKTKKEEGIGDQDITEFRDHVVIIGGHQMGESVLVALEEVEEKVLVIDFDPDIVHRLKKKEKSIFFGDISDVEIQERAGIDHAKLVISTVPDLEDNLLLIKELNKHNRKAKIIVMAFEADEARQLYKAGADYVVLPHLAGGRHLAKILKDKTLEKIAEFKEKDLAFLP